MFVRISDSTSEERVASHVLAITVCVGTPDAEAGKAIASWSWTAAGGSIVEGALVDPRASRSSARRPAGAEFALSVDTGERGGGAAGGFALSGGLSDCTDRASAALIRDS